MQWSRSLGKVRNDETGETEADRVKAARAERLAEIGIEDDLVDDTTDAPNFVPGADFFWQAFIRLSKGRQIGMSIGPISFMDMVSYCMLYAVQEIDDFESIISAVDDFFLATMPGKEDGDRPGMTTDADGSRELTGDDSETHERRWLGSESG